MQIRTNLIFCAILGGLIAIAIIFGTVETILSNKKNRGTTLWQSIIISFSKILFNISVGIAILIVPVFVLANVIRPIPEKVMPAIAYDGARIAYEPEVFKDEVDYYNYLFAQIDDCTQYIDMYGNVSDYYERACFYFKAGDFQSARADLEYCYNHEKRWIYAYDLGVTYGYLLEYDVSIKYFEEALNLDIPYPNRIAVNDSIDLISSYFIDWIRSWAS